MLSLNVVPREDRPLTKLSWESSDRSTTGSCGPEAAAGGITGTTRRRTPDMSGAWHRPQLMTRSLAKRLLLDAGRALATFQAGR